jgi:hypothetical protein
MNIVYLFGGLGNMLFQLNYAYRLMQAGNDVELNFFLGRSSFFVNNLLKWTTHGSENVILDMDLVDSFSVTMKISALSLINLALSKSSLSRFSNLRWVGHSTPPIPNYPLKIRSSPVGYFQFNNPTSPLLAKKIAYFADSHILKDKSRALPNLISSINSCPDSILIHVRGGDFLNTNASTNCSLPYEYYSNALNEYRNVYVVSNDHAYARELLSPLKSNLIQVRTSSVIDDFCLILKAKRKLLSNSTFSWWAAECGMACDTIIEPYKFYNHIDWRAASIQGNRIPISFDF